MPAGRLSITYKYRNYDNGIMSCTIFCIGLHCNEMFMAQRIIIIITFIFMIIVITIDVVVVVVVVRPPRRLGGGGIPTVQYHSTIISRSRGQHNNIV